MIKYGASGYNISRKELADLKEAAIFFKVDWAYYAARPDKARKIIADHCRELEKEQEGSYQDSMAGWNK